MTKVFIDGSAGTTGLRINERLAERKDIEIIKLDESVRKDPSARKEALFAADIAFLCLPDAAAVEAADLARGSDTVIIDTSTAHRCASGWTYGFPEVIGREEIAGSGRIANPGCHASGFISLVAPLTEYGIIPKDTQLTCFSLTGYSGGGKKMIAEYEGDERDLLLDAPRMYGLTQNHKHLPEMARYCKLDNNPVFCPVVAPYYSGMEVVVPLFGDMTDCKTEEIKKAYRQYYKTGLVKYSDCEENGFVSAGSMSGRDDMIISVFGNDDRILLVSRFDNLGKGASGAAIQNMNIVMGIDEKTGLQEKSI